MHDVTNAAIVPKTTRLDAYAPSAFLIDTVDLIVDLREDMTLVRSRLAVRRNPAAPDQEAPLSLDGRALILLSLRVNGEELGPDRYRLEADTLTIADVLDAFVLDVETEIRPQDNTELSGLYKSGGNFCTQCEPEGFRRITYFIDRPDVMARFSTTIVADKSLYPVLLSNGNPVDRGTNVDGRHWSKWDDPHPKPSYLFALVAGQLIAMTDQFTTKSGRSIPLAIWVRSGDEDKCTHAMTALKASMAWDERVFGLEYDLDVFNIVAVGDFNMGAMENKGLNIFNTRYVLAKPATATDGDYQGIERVIAHEYFHNWTGNRVTCRDWFQLSLKEGLTVFRDQEFMSDRHSRPVKRISDVRGLRAGQFPEDDGPLAHPVRPDSYIEIDNFYTSTVYNKGAELVRMIHTMLGAEKFRAGMDLYFQRHDNQAVTIEDFVAAMRDASGIDLNRFKRWYSQAGTPEITVDDFYEPETRRYALTVTQTSKPTPGQDIKLPLVIPLAMGLIGEDGMALPARFDGEREIKADTRVLLVTEPKQTFWFDGITSRPIPSLLRGFSAPVKLRGVGLERLKFLATYDSDPFARWDAGQRVASHVLLELVAAWRRGDTLDLDPDLLEAFSQTLKLAGADPEFAAEALLLPSESLLADQLPVADIDGIHAARFFAKREIGKALSASFLTIYENLTDHDAYRPDGASMARRALRNLCLGYLGATNTEHAIGLAKAQFDHNGNMTDVLAALAVLNEVDRRERRDALAQFYAAWQSEQLVVDKWFSIQAMSSLPDTLDAVAALARHSAFDIKNPNRVRSLVGAFSQGNPLRFHDHSGRGYGFLADQVLVLDRINALMAARLVQPLGNWRRYDRGRQELMRSALDRILETPGLSKHTFEMASKSLA